MRTIKLAYDFVVVGGGLSGLLAALAASRKGVKTALVHNRSVLGGNASSEFRMHICGADDHMSKPNLRETGILEEILLENKRINPEQSWALWDNLLWSKCKSEKSLDLYLDTTFLACKVVDSRIKVIECYHTESETTYLFSAAFFCDATGDSSLGFKAGALYAKGREASSTYKESLAPEKADNVTMGSSLMFSSRHMGYPIPFEKPEWAVTYTEEELALRDHSDPEAGYWWIELGGEKEDTIEDSMEIHDKLFSTLYGIWDHIKNRPGHNSEDLLLDWVSPVVGKRESRRLLGDYVLIQNDIDTQRIFEDAVAYGGWPMDIHTTGGISAKGNAATVWNKCSFYTIPYRSYYSRNIDNLFMAGRNISASHVAFSSTRVMATCAIGGQAVGMAVSLALEKGFECTREVGNEIKTLQQKLLLEDCFIPGVRNESEDLALTAEPISSSGKAYNINNGYNRTIGGKENFWQPDAEDTEKTLTLKLKEEKEISKVYLFFDSNLSREITPSIINEVKLRQPKGTPPELVKSFKLTFFLRGKELFSSIYATKGQRYCPIFLDPVLADKVQLQLISSYGALSPKVFEMRLY